MNTIEQIGNELFEQFQDILPSPSQRDPKQSARIKKDGVEGQLDRFYTAARVLRAKHRLGFIGRARVIRRLQSRMMAAGYEGDLVYRVVFSLLLSAFVGPAK